MEQKPQKQLVKGIYVSAWSAVGKKFEQLIQLVEQTDLNAMVIDVKNDSGQVTYPSVVPLVNEIGANSHTIIGDIKSKLQRLKQNGIYTIARIVVFKDPYLSKKKSNYTLLTRSGNVWRDSKGTSWVDPYKEEVWDYNIQIAKEVAELGFDEIQFDYVRFPDNGKKVDREVNFDNPQHWTKAQVIEAFLKRAKERVGGQAFLSADVFGMTTSSDNDMGIGQEWTRISKQVHFISPMLYPSHYSSGIYGVKNPDLQPYAIISKAISDAISKNDQLERANTSIAEIRPWYQDFTATWVKPHKTYGSVDVREQIKAAKEHGIEQFLLWNSNSMYSYR
ncbi:putative glycoside hydrolase [Paenibacillus sp. SYP-B3998]|uniref:Putative glycoside hydrolase n=2 Tax=Paenibacillus sp. SYP-B3998 TaxID=2678564 RepID=A0A6G4A4R6_9BACL|nr:putative glycoside hydrolase [Paenibacillus sp. SYP-B3998]